MFDFSRITDTLGGLFSSGEGLQDTIGEVLAGVDLDPAILESVNLDQLTETLSASGMDVASLSEGELGELLQKCRDGGA